MLIAQLERRSGQTGDTIRYYERLGLITPPQRGDNGYRLYDERAVVKLNFIAKAQEVGFTLQQIKPSMAHVHAPPEQCQALIDGLQAKRAMIDARVAQDRTRLVRLNKMIRRLKGGRGLTRAPFDAKKCHLTNHQAAFGLILFY